MKKNTNEILAQIHSELQDVIRKAAELETRMSELVQSQDDETPTVIETETEAASPATGGFAVDEAFDIMMGDEVDFIQPAPKSESRPEPEQKPSGEPDFRPEPEQKPAGEPDFRPEPEQKSAPKAESRPEPEQKPATESKGRPEPVHESILTASEPEPKSPKAEKKVRKTAGNTVQPTMFYAWQTDTPASPLSNILSGIALKDRALIIGILFQDDAQLFIDTISKFNKMHSLTEAESYIHKRFPRWKLDSDSVYRLMMAVRRKLN